jgi:3-oxoacyl-[acyl-carrier protein] reductase
MANRLNAKTAIVTGSSRGIGAAIAEHLAAEQANIVVNYVNGKAEAESVVSKITAAGGRAISVRADVSTSAGAKALFDAAEAKYGPADILVNNAGVILYKLLAAVTEEEYDQLFAVNVKGTFLTCKLAATRLKDNGAIINFSSSTTVMMLPTYSKLRSNKRRSRTNEPRLCKRNGRAQNSRQRNFARSHRHRHVQHRQKRRRSQTRGNPRRLGPPRNSRRHRQSSDLASLRRSHLDHWPKHPRKRWNHLSTCSSPLQG